MTLPRRHLWVLALAAALVVQILGLYAPRGPDLGGVAVPGMDKLGHVAMFAAVTLTAIRAGVRTSTVVVWSLVHAAVSELVQHVLLPGRSGDVLDVVADALGVALGAWGAALLGGAATGRLNADGREGSGPDR